MSIDDKLREILKSASISGKYGDTREATYLELTARLKRVFADEGYVKNSSSYTKYYKQYWEKKAARRAAGLDQS